MGTVTTPHLPTIVSNSNTIHHSFSILDKSNPSSSMSHDYHQGIFSFSNGFERSPITHQEHHHQHIASQIRRDKVRVQDFEPPAPPLVGLADEESGGLPVYETSGMLSEMFNFPPAGATAAQLLDSHSLANYRSTRPQPAATGVAHDWFGNRHGFASGFGALGEAKGQNTSVSGRENIAQQHHHHQISSINADSAAAMHLFLMNPETRSPSPPPPHSHNPNTRAATSTLHMLLPNPSSSSLRGLTGNGSSAEGGAFGQFTWVPDSGHEGNTTTNQLNSNPSAGGVVEGQGLSLSLSSSLQHLEAAKAEEFRMRDNGFLYYNQGTGGASSAAKYYKNLSSHNQQPLQSQGHVAPNHQIHVAFGSSLGAVNVLRNSKYVKAAQELLEEFCSVGRSQFKKNKFGWQNSNPNSNPGASTDGGVTGGLPSSSKDAAPLSAADRIEHQRRKVKLLAMLDEVDRRYNHYCEQMQMVVNSFDMVMGFGAAVPYTALAQKAMSRHFRCLKDAIIAQLKRSCELLGEKDGAGNSGLTKGETPRLKLLEQSLRQQRAFHQMGMMEQEAWRPQRGLPERSVNFLRAWLFEHFLHPYPSDADKHLLARQTGLSRNQVSNWFINARVRLWKPMVEEMYQQEAKEEDGTDEDTEKNQSNDSGFAQTPTSTATAATQAARVATPPPLSSTTTIIQPTTYATVSTTITAGKRSDINASESDPSLVAINRQCFSENQAKQSNPCISPTTIMAPTIPTNAINSEVAPPASQCSGTPHDSELQTSRSMDADDTCKLGTIVSADYGTSSSAADLGSTLIRFGTTPGDVSLTLGLRHHAANVPEKSSAFSIRDFGAI